VVREDLIDATGKVVERIAVCRKHTRTGNERTDRTRQESHQEDHRANTDTDRRSSDPSQHVIAREQDAFGLVHQDRVIVV